MDFNVTGEIEFGKCLLFPQFHFLSHISFAIAALLRLEGILSACLTNPAQGLPVACSLT